MTEQRKALFRGKRKDNNEWVYGGVGYFPNKIFIIQYVHGCDNLSNEEYEAFDEIDIIPETLSQFTGLCDSNGAKIFEGDILKVDLFRKITDCNIYQVKFIDAAFRLFKENSWYSFSIANNFEIIGNIHDNPELLEKSNDF